MRKAPQKISINRKKKIATEIIAQSDRTDLNAIAKANQVSERTVGRVRDLIKAGDSLTIEEIEKNPDIRKIYDKSLMEWIAQAKKRIANITLNNAVKFLQEANDPDKIKKMSAAQAQLSGKIALDTALLATGQMPAANAPSVKIYLPATTKEGWTIIKDAEVVDEKKE